MARGKDYLDVPVTIVFKTSDRSNAQTKIKTFKNRNIDQVLEDKLPGVPDKAVVLDIGVGSIFESRYKKKYGIK